MNKSYKQEYIQPVIVDHSEYTYKEVYDIKKENEYLQNIAKARYENNKVLMTKWINRGKTIKELNRATLHKDAMIRQLEKIIYKLYTGREELSTGDLQNIVRIVEGYNGK